MVCVMQWVIALGRFDILTAGDGEVPCLPMDQSPRQSEAHVRVSTKVQAWGDTSLPRDPDMSQFPNSEYDWLYTVYGDAQEQIPHDAPEPLGKEVITITCLLYTSPSPRD